MINKMIKIIFIIILLCFLIPSFLCVCGPPGHSLKSLPLFDSLNSNKLNMIYPEGSVVHYKCVYADDTFLFGPNSRKCENNEWSDEIPNCGRLFPGLTFSQ